MTHTNASEIHEAAASAGSNSVEKLKLGTVCVHGGEPNPRVNGSAVMPIFQSSTFTILGTHLSSLRPLFERNTLFDSGHIDLMTFSVPCYLFTGTEKAYDDVRYTRCNNNPSQEVVADKIARLEGMRWTKRCSTMLHHDDGAAAVGGR